MKKEFWKRVGKIPWHELEHSYGKATNIPDLLKGLTSKQKKKRENAYNYLDWSLNHQGMQRWEATAYVVPFLIELLTDSSTPERHLICVLLTDFAIGYTHSAYLTNGFHIHENYPKDGLKLYYDKVKSKEISDIYYSSLLRKIYKEVKKGIPIYSHLLQSNDEKLRAFVPYVLAWLTDSGNSTMPYILTQWQAEKNKVVKASQCLALSFGCLYQKKWKQKIKNILNKQFQLTEEGFEKSMLALGLLRLGVVSEEIRDVLCKELEQPNDYLTENNFPWHFIVAKQIIASFLISIPNWELKIILSISKGFPKYKNRHRGDDTLYSMAWYMLNYGFEKFPLKSGDLSHSQKEILKALGQNKDIWQDKQFSYLMEEYYLPGTKVKLLAYVNNE